MSQNFSFHQAMVIGTDTVGHGIVICLADTGLGVQWLDSNPQMPNQTFGVITDACAHNAHQGYIGEEEAAMCRAHTTPVQHLTVMREADLVIEAVYENLELKQSIFRELDAVLKPSAMLASNTSHLDIDTIATVTARLGQVFSPHFFSPAHIVRLLEIVHDAQTAPTVPEAALMLGERMGKVSVVTGDCHGSIDNRMLESYATEAHLMLLGGTLPYQVDRALRAFGFAIEPLRMYDVVGIDLEWRTRELAGVGQNQPVVQVDNRLYELGCFGQKSGAGYYRYTPGSHQAEYDTEVDTLALRVVETLNYLWCDFADEEILERYLLALVNEGTKILDEDTAARNVDIDTVHLNGCNFSAVEGGPTAWADRLGAAELLRRLRLLEQRHGAC